MTTPEINEAYLRLQEAALNITAARENRDEADELYETARLEFKEANFEYEKLVRNRTNETDS